MFQLQFISDVSGLNEKESLELFQLHKGPVFFKSTNTAEFDTLLEMNYVIPTGSKFMISEKGLDVILEAIEAYAKTQPLKDRPSRARTIREEMTEHMEFIYANINIPLKEVIIDRSNYIIHFHERTKCVRWLEVRNAGEFRLSCYKMDQSEIDKLANLGMTYRQVNHVTWMDIPCNIENIQKILGHLEFLKA